MNRLPSVLWLCMLLSMALPARADDAALARQAFERGVAASEASDWGSARVAFEQSQRLAPKATTLFNLALSQLRLELHAETLATLREFDALADPELHQHLVDRAGAVRLEAEAMAARARIRSIERDMQRRAQAAASVSAASAPTASERAAGAGRYLLITGAGVAVGAVASGLWWRDRAQSADACHRPEGITCREEQQIERQQRAAVALSITLGAAAVGLLATGAVWLMKRGNAGPTRAVNKHVVLSWGGAALRF